MTDKLQKYETSWRENGINFFTRSEVRAVVGQDRLHGIIKGYIVDHYGHFSHRAEIVLRSDINGKIEAVITETLPPALTVRNEPDE